MTEVGKGVTEKLRKAYALFLEYDRKSSIRAATTYYGKSVEEAERAWSILYKPSYFEFESLAYRLLRLGHVRGLVRAALILPEKALNVARALEEVGILELLDDGSVKVVIEPFRIRDLDPSLLDIVPEIKADFGLDQLQCSRESLLARISEINKDLPLDGKTVALMGDDDFQSLVLAGNFDVKVTVFELDERILAAIAKIAERKGFSVELVRHDLTKPLPEKHKNSYDLFLADPTYTLSGIETFCLRGWEALVKERGRRGYVSFLPDELGKKLSRVFQSISTLGFSIERIVIGLNSYIVEKDSPIYRLVNEVTAEMKRPTQLTESVVAYLSNLYVLKLEDPDAGRSFKPSPAPIYDYYALD